MNGALLQNGTEIAEDLRTSSDQIAIVQIRTTGDLLATLQADPPRSFRMLRTTCGLLGIYLGQPGDQIPFDTIDARRRGFRQFLESRKYAKNSIRTYVYQTRLLLKTARRLGWDPDNSVSEEWKAFMVLAADKNLRDIARHFSRITRKPADVTFKDVDNWAESQIRDGLLFTTVASKKNRFWRLLSSAGWTTISLPVSIKHDKYGIPLHQLPKGLRSEVEVALKWKQADFARNRPKRGKIRAVSANNLRLAICQLAGFAINVYGIQPASLFDLVQKDVLESFVEWAINERCQKGQTLQSRIGMLSAVMSHHPAYASQDFAWLKALIDSIPLEDDSERKQRKAEKYVEYDVLEAIPTKIRAFRDVCDRATKNDKRVARLAMEELMIRWLLVLPWRQRNIRECRVSGSSPNLFKGRIPPFSDLDKPEWVVAEEARNPNAEFWQIRFSPKETKTKIAVHILLPRQLITSLEEYLAEYRPRLLADRNTDTLFLNHNGKPMRADLVDNVIGNWSLRFCGIRTTPHLFRDSTAFKWLKEHPKDYLTLSKLLWHKNVQTTIRIYGARFNESSGACAMEAWLDERAASK